MRARLVVLLTALGWAWSGEAAAVEPPTVYDNAHMYPIGSRAAGMAGAYTALGCDEAAIHYNPASLGCAGSSRLELAANAYMIQSLSVPNAFGANQDVDAITFHSIPSIVGGARVLRDPDDERGGGRVVFGLSVEVPHSLSLSGVPSSPEDPNYLQIEVRDSITTGDIGLGWQINEYIAIGAAIGAGFRSYEARGDLLLVDPFFIPCLDGQANCLSFYYASRSEEAVAIGGRGKLGVRLTPIDHWAFGLSFTSPSLDIWGSSNAVLTDLLAIGDPGSAQVEYFPLPARVEGSSELSMPMRLALGVAYMTDGFTLSFDASLNFPHIVRTAHELQQIELDQIPALSPDDLEAQERIRLHGWQPNFNLGAEFGVSEDVVIDVGAFTDLSSVSDVDIDNYDVDRVHMFGASLALGLLGRQARAWLGMSFEYGQSSSLVKGGALDLNEVLINGFELDDLSPISRWTLTGIIGSNYSFIAEEPEPDVSLEPPVQSNRER